MTLKNIKILIEGHNVVLSEEDIIIRYDGPPEVLDDCASYYEPDDVDQLGIH